MSNKSVTHVKVEMQQDTLRNDVIVQFLGNEVFCPMCEVWHENNTLCQMSWSD